MNVHEYFIRNNQKRTCHWFCLMAQFKLLLSQRKKKKKKKKKTSKKYFIQGEINVWYHRGTHIHVMYKAPASAV